MIKSPYPFQCEAIDRIRATHGFILADECGLGKTITAIESTRGHSPKNWRCLVICPPALLGQWQDEILTQGFHPIHIVNRLPINLVTVTGWILMSIYDLSSELVRNSLYSTLFDVVIVDECHRIKNRKTKTAQWIKKIFAAKRIALTGTPMEKNPADLWSILNFVSPDDFPAYWGFVMKHLQVEAGYWERYIVGGPKDPEAFGDLLYPYMLRRTKSEVAPQLPEKIMIEQHVLLEPDQKSIYDTIRREKDIIVTVADKQLLILNALSLLTKLQQISVYPALLGFENVDSGKLLWLQSFLEDNPDDNVVVFTRFREVAKHVAEKYGADLVIGGERHLSEKPHMAVGTIDAMGEGLNFQWAKHAIFLDSHWSTIKMTQAIDRVHRIDITEPKNIYCLWSTPEDLLVLDTIDHKMSEAELVYYFLRGSAV